MARDFSRRAILGLGGGWSGINSVGAIRADCEFMPKPKVVRGDSVNALNFAMAVQHGWDARPLEKVWLDLEKKGPEFIFDFKRWETVRRFFLKKPDILRNDGIRYLAKRLDINKILSSDIEYQTPVLNENTGKEEIFSTRDSRVTANPELLRQAIIASASFPGLFPTVIIEDAPYCDAVDTEVIPDVRSLLNLGCDSVFIFINSTRFHKVPKKIWWFPRILQMVHRSSNTNLDNAVQFYGEQAIVVRPDRMPDTLSRTSFKLGDFQKALEWSYESAKKVYLPLVQ